MREKIIFTVISTFLTLLSFAQSELDCVKENTYYFEINKLNIVGEGADVLKKSIEESQFFVLGEEHFSAKVSEFTNAIIPILANENYKYFVAEIGSNSANIISDIIKNDASLYEFNSKTYNLVGEVPVPFFDGKEDEVFLKNALDRGFELWGIDQEYLTSQVFLIDEIYKLSNNKTELYHSYHSAKDFIIEETKKYWDKFTNYKLFTKLLDSPIVWQFFKKTESTNSKVQKIISDLKNSWEVYRLREVKNFYSSAHKRINMLKNNFIDYYSKTLKVDTLPKAIIKIGGVHAAKGRSTDNIFDIGNFLMELANLNGQKSTSILVFPSEVIGDGESKNNIDKEDEIFIRPLINKAKGRWVLIDLKKIEEYSWKNKVEYKSLKDYMRRFDYLILTPPSKETTWNFKH